MSLLLSSCRPFLRSLPPSFFLPSITRIPHSLSARSFQTPAQTSETSQPSETSQASEASEASPQALPKFAFAFDVDGVLIHGSKPAENATKALSLLSKNAVEFILLTNGGGKSEATRAAELSDCLNHTIHPAQFIQSHTPFTTLASDPNFSTVLVVGGEADNCRHVAKEYGFRNVILPCDILAAHPSVSPFSVNKTPEYAQPLPEGEVKIDAILVFNDPRDWALDIQLMIDILVSDQGRLGTRRSDQCRKPHVPLFFSNPDLLWANEYHLPRLAQAGFRAAFTGSWNALKRIGKWDSMPMLTHKTFGKPNKLTYEFAETLLFEWRKTQLAQAGVAEPFEDVKTVYMVGDNPRSDITGANHFKSPKGVKWVSILVKSGVFRDGDSTLGAKAVVGDVLDAVNWAIAREQDKLLRGVEEEEDEPTEGEKQEGSETENTLKNKKKGKYNSHWKMPRRQKKSGDYEKKSGEDGKKSGEDGKKSGED